MKGVKIAETPKIRIDPVTLDIIEGALKNARFEMDVVLFRTAMSPVIREQHDEFPMLTDPQGRMVVGQFGSYIAEMMQSFEQTLGQNGQIEVKILERAFHIDGLRISSVVSFFSCADLVLTFSQLRKPEFSLRVGQPDLGDSSLQVSGTYKGRTDRSTFLIGYDPLK